jgi:arylsulfatase A-like enzyme
MLLSLLSSDTRPMKRRWACCPVGLLAVLLFYTPALYGQQPRSEKPNIILIYADDIGYGDLGCYGSKVKTPNADRLAKEGIRHRRGYSTSASCTPSRYSMMTGEYAWRKPGTGILPGDAPALLLPGRQTLPSMLKQAGYRTGVVGKWHLGLGGPERPQWNTQLTRTPNDVGFDESFIMAATGDRAPTVYVENGRVVNLDPADPIQVSYKAKIGSEPTGSENPELLTMKHSHGHDNTIVNGVGRIGWMTGGKAARWTDEDMADTFTKRAVQFIENNRPTASGKPFFLYFATHDIHVPRVPHPRFVGKSGMGPRGDALLEFDWSVGEVLQTLDRLGLAQNTLVILTSDNGAVVDDGYQDQAVEKLGDHRPTGGLRGGKGGSFEGGTRVPLLVRWPAQRPADAVKPGVSDALFSQIDLMASLAALTSQTVDRSTAPDTENHLDALLGRNRQGRALLIEHAGLGPGGRGLAVTNGEWKYIEPGNPSVFSKFTNTELGGSDQPQLYHLTTDPGERTNVAAQHPDVVKRLQEGIETVRKQVDPR